MSTSLLHDHLPARTRLTPSEVAAYMGVTMRHVRNLIDCGALEAISVAVPGATRPRWRVSRDSVVKFVLSRQADVGGDGQHKGEER